MQKEALGKTVHARTDFASARAGQLPLHPFDGIRHKTDNAAYNLLVTIDLDGFIRRIIIQLLIPKSKATRYVENLLPFIISTVM